MLILFLPIIITIIYLKKITITTLKVVLILLIVHFSFNFIWNQYKIKINNEPVYGISIINGEKPNIFEKTVVRSISKGIAEIGKQTTIAEL